MTVPTTALIDLLRAGPVPAAQVLARLGISRPTLSRQVRDVPSVVRIGRARATRYALSREIRAFGSQWPLFRIGVDGRPMQAGMLHALRPSAWWYEHEPRPPWLVEDFAEGLFPDFPWFLDDLRPQGFMGRAFARRHAASLGLSPDPRLWDAAGVLIALLLFGEDLPGDWVVGEEALARAQRASLQALAAIPRAGCAARYGDLATAALQGEIAGSSAAGEQPKLTACVDDSGALRHVLVKFSPRLDTVGGRRWADLLVCEHLAERLLREHQIPACETRIVEGANRRFLEVTRFDRVGAFGRRGFVSLFALDAAYYGKLDTWVAAAGRLERDGWLDANEARRLRLLGWFGSLIGNGDMRFGNVSLALNSRPCSLAPAYDMLPMNYRPEAGGEIVPRTLEPPLPPPGQLDVWRDAAHLAQVFWEHVAGDGRISSELQAEAVRNRDLTRTLLDRL